MSELDQAIAGLKSADTGLSEDDLSDIKNILIQEGKDRKEKEMVKRREKALQEQIARMRSEKILSDDRRLQLRGL